MLRRLGAAAFERPRLDSRDHRPVSSWTMILAFSPRGRVCAAVVLVLALLVAPAHACASLSAAHPGEQASFGAHQGALGHMAEPHGSCGEAGFSSAPASTSGATVETHVLAFDSPVAGTMAPIFQMVAAVPAPMPHRHLPLVLLHAVLRV